MARIEKDEDRENRIDMEVVVDAYDSEERAMGWYYYVADNCNFSFKATCTSERRTSPLTLNEEVEVLDIASTEECASEMFVNIKFNKRKLAVPLSQLIAIDTDNETRKIIEDWHYWVKREYEF